ncbi:MAG: hypothetical protein U0Q12_17290 [Vicinamibacterales bacterium]
MLSRTRALWSLVREIDLKTIQTEALRGFRIGVASDSPELGAAVARVLTGDAAGPIHPWIDLVHGRAADGGRDWLLSLVVSSSPDLTSELADFRDVCARAGVAVGVFVVGDVHASQLAVREHERVRVGGATVDAATVERLVAALLDAVPGLPEVALARQLPGTRGAVFSRLIELTSRANATYALTAAVAETMPIVSVPLNVADIVVLTKNQLVMAYKIALGAGKSGQPRDLLGEIVGVLGSGFLFRQGARQLVGLIPVVGILPKVAIAYAGTWAVGQATVAWATKGGAVTADAVKRFYEDARRRSREVAVHLLRQRRTGK